MSSVPYPPFPPMEAAVADELPAGPRWLYEPKWDGFRCLAFRDGNHVELQSQAGRPLGRYFPEVVAGLRAMKPRSFVLDGELVIDVDGVPSFEALQLRLHPAESRVRMLADATPARLVAFDLLGVDRRGLVDRPLAERRRTLERFVAHHGEPEHTVRLSPATADLDTARSWLVDELPGQDGVVAKRLDLPYRAGERDGMVKVKRLHTVDCVVGGFRYAAREAVVGSLLLGLYDEAGLLHHVGFMTSLREADRAALTERLEALVEPPGFTGRRPDADSRWGSTRGGAWQPLRPQLVVEVQYGHFTGGRLRHGATLLRWRPDKPPGQCTMDQVRGVARLGLSALPPGASSAAAGSTRSRRGSRRRRGRGSRSRADDTPAAPR
jgi:ATP-dependent DNA ligase